MVYLKYLVFLVFFISCSSTKQSSIELKLPSWYLNTPNNTNNFIYGVGEAFTLKEAKLLALDDMSNKLIVQLESSFSSNTKSSTNYYEKTSSLKLKQIGKRIIFNNYKTIKTKYQDGVYYVLLEVNREKLFTFYKNKFDLINTNIQSININNKSKLEQIKTLQNLNPNIKKAKELLNILSAIDNNFKQEKYLSFYNKLQNKIIYLKQNLTINIECGEKLFTNELTKFINENNYNIANKNFDVKITCDNVIRYSRAYSWNIVKVNTSIKAISNNKILSSNTVKFNGRSSSSYKSSLANASLNFYNELLNIGINKILFNTTIRNNR